VASLPPAGLRLPPAGLRLHLAGLMLEEGSSVSRGMPPAPRRRAADGEVLEDKLQVGGPTTTLPEVKGIHAQLRAVAVPLPVQAECASSENLDAIKPYVHCARIRIKIKSRVVPGIVGDCYAGGVAVVRVVGVWLDTEGHPTLAAVAPSTWGTTWNETQQVVAVGPEE